MHFRGALRLTAVLSMMVLAVAACSADINVRGNSIDKERLSKIRPGVQDRAAVRKLLGSPTNIATFSDDTWYYISQKDRTVAFSRPVPLSRDILAISFDNLGRVAKVKHTTLANAKKISPVGRTTPSPGREFNILEQLLGNLGRFENSPQGGL